MYVQIDLGYRVAYLMNDLGEAQAAQSSVTRSSVDDVLTSWGYVRTRNGKWETTDILNAIDAVRFPVEVTKARIESA